MAPLRVHRVDSSSASRGPQARMPIFSLNPEACRRHLFEPELCKNLVGMLPQARRIEPDFRRRP